MAWHEYCQEISASSCASENTEIHLWPFSWENINLTELVSVVVERTYLNLRVNNAGVDAAKTKRVAQYVP